MNISRPLHPTRYRNPALRLKALQLDQVWEAGYTGRSVTIAVIDSGKPEHPELSDRLLDFHDSGVPGSGGDAEQAHATGVAMLAAGDGSSTRGMLAGAAPEAGVVGIRVSGLGGRITPEAVLDAVEWSIANKERLNIRVMNMSFYMDGWNDDKKEEVYQAVRRASELGIIPVTTSGNDGEGNKPGTMNSGLADLDCVITVAASDVKAPGLHTPPEQLNGTPGLHRIPGFSGRAEPGSDKPDVTAPGNEVVTGKVQSGFERQSGTSFAAPIVSGIIADWVQANPTLSVKDVQQIIEKTSLELPGVAREAQGHGVIQAKAGLDMALTMVGRTTARLLDTPLHLWTEELMTAERARLGKTS